MSETVEAVRFSLATGNKAADFVSANSKVNDWLLKQPGFLKRYLIQLEDGNWLDSVHWSSSTDAKQAADRFMEELAGCDCMRMIDPDSIMMSHSELRITI